MFWTRPSAINPKDRERGLILIIIVVILFLSRVENRLLPLSNTFLMLFKSRARVTFQMQLSSPVHSPLGISQTLPWDISNGLAHSWITIVRKISGANWALTRSKVVYENAHVEQDVCVDSIRLTRENDIILLLLALERKLRGA